MNIDSQIQIINYYNISIEELFVVQLLFLAQPEEGHPELLKEYISCKKRSELRQVLLNLQEAEILLKSYKIPQTGERFIPENVEFNKNFVKRYFGHSGDLGYELWQSYPNLLYINSAYFPAKNIAKKFNSMDEFFYAYGKAIKFSLTKHKEVIELVEWAKDNNLIVENLANFVINHQWEVLKELKESGFDGQSMKIDELL